MHDQRTLPKNIAGYQSWSDLTFLHWRIEPESIQKLLPPGLTVETFDHSAWVGIVPFSMEKVRPWWAPAVPGISWFLETNVRTYVRHTNGDTGVWFFSLDANSRLAVRVARTFWRLPYFYSRLKRLSDTTGKDESRTYTGSRADRQSTSYKIRIEFKPTEELQEAQDGTLEHFLLERYLLFAAGKTGSEIYSGRVHHVPYQFRKCTVHECSQQLLTASGITCDNGLPVHAAHSPGVEVVVSPLQKL